MLHQRAVFDDGTVSWGFVGETTEDIKRKVTQAYFDKRKQEYELVAAEDAVEIERVKLARKSAIILRNLQASEDRRALAKAKKEGTLKEHTSKIEQRAIEIAMEKIQKRQAELARG